MPWRSAAFTEIVTVVGEKFGLTKMVMVGDRGMITAARIDALGELDDPIGWVTGLRAPAIKKLAAEDGQMSLFDTRDLAEIAHPDYPCERLIACRNPVLAADHARTREDLLAATEKLLAPIAAGCGPGGWPDPPRSGSPWARSSTHLGTPVQRSAHAQAEASCQHDQAGQPYRSFSGLLDHLATLTRNQVRFAGADAEVPMLAEPTPDQRHAFDLIEAPIPLTLT